MLALSYSTAHCTQVLVARFCWWLVACSVTLWLCTSICRLLRSSGIASGQPQHVCEKLYTQLEVRLPTGCGWSQTYQQDDAEYFVGATSTREGMNVDTIIRNISYILSTDILMHCTCVIGWMFALQPSMPLCLQGANGPLLWVDQFGSNGYLQWFWITNTLTRDIRLVEPLRPTNENSIGHVWYTNT